VRWVYFSEDVRWCPDTERLAFDDGLLTYWTGKAGSTVGGKCVLVPHGSRVRRSGGAS